MNMDLIEDIRFSSWIKVGLSFGSNAKQFVNISFISGDMMEGTGKRKGLISLDDSVITSIPVRSSNGSLL